MAVLIRLATNADAPAIAAIYAPYVTNSRISFEEIAPDDAEIRQRLIGEHPGYHPWFVAEEGGRILGFANSAPYRTRRAYRWTVETGIYLAVEACGRGIGFNLLSKLLGVLERQGYFAAIGAIALSNASSVALHEKLGFTFAGTYRQVGFKGGEWIDVCLWQKDLGQRSSNPLEPTAFAAVAPPPFKSSLQPQARIKRTWLRER
jgi:L-amino acid N-acyltransferase YncA